MFQAWRDQWEGVLADLESNHQSLVFREESIQEDGAGIVEAIARKCGRATRPDEIAQVAGRFERQAVQSAIALLTSTYDWQVEFEQFDPETGWHANHVSLDPTYSRHIAAGELPIVESIRTRLACID